MSKLEKRQLLQGGINMREKRWLRRFLGVLCGYLVLVKPGKYRPDWATPYENNWIAHRGLFDKENGIPENSLPAFQRAIEAGYGIELDVQLTQDCQLVVFHDENLKRMCGVDRKICDCMYEELLQYKLQESQAHIPLFSEVLAIMTPETPWIIEVKPEGDHIGCVETLMSYLSDYQGLFVVESFHPAVLRWLRRHEPQVIRGQLSSNMFFEKNVKHNIFVKLFLTNLLGNFLSRPDFIAYNHKHANQISYRICRWLFRTKHAAWTIKNQRELESARKKFTIFIFDSFIPEKK